MEIQHHVAVFENGEIELAFVLERKVNREPYGICEEFYSLFDV
jgi:hypothetical protein